MNVIVVSYSELASGRQCPLKHHLEYKQRWTKPLKTDDKRALGTLWHEVLAVHYSVLQVTQDKPELTDPERLLLAAESVAPLLEPADTPGQEHRDLVEWMYVGHVEKYGADPDWEILAVEYATQVPLLNEAGNRTRFRLKLKIDLVIRDRFTGRLRIVDHKSAGDLERPVESDLDDQFGLYTWAMRQQGRPVQCSVYSGARTQKLKRAMTLDERYARRLMLRTDKELDNLALDAWRTAAALYRPGVPYSSPDPQTCRWKCDHRDPHLMMRKGIGTPEQIMVDFGFHQDFTRH